MASNPDTAAPDIYGQLKTMILSFALYPGTRVTENELAERFGVSRTPVREALQRLAADGYISIRPKQGCFVRDIDIEEINHYYAVRIALELYAIELAALNMPDHQLSELARAWDPARASEAPGDLERMVARDESFHLAIAAGTGNPVLARYLKDVNERIHIVRRLDFTEPARIAQTYAEHAAVIAALAKRDPEAAKALLLKHIRKSADVARTITLTQLAQQRIRAQARP